MKELQLNVALNTCLQFLSVSVLEKTQISCALQQTYLDTLPHYHANQLMLFDIKSDTTDAVTAITNLHGLVMGRNL